MGWPVLVSMAVGGIAGGLAGLLDAAPAWAAGGPRALGAGWGVGACLGLLAGGLAGWSRGARAPIGWPARLRRLHRALWRGRHHPLQDQTRAVATLWVAAAALHLALPLGVAGATRILGRVQSALFAGLGVALVALGLLLVLGPVAVTVRAGVGRGLEGLARRWPRALGPWVHPLPHSVGALGWLAFSAYTWAQQAPEGVVGPTVRLVGSLAIGVGVGVGLTPPALRWRPAQRAGVVWVWVGASALLAVGAALVGLAHPGSRAALGAHASVTGWMARATRSAETPALTPADPVSLADP